jgi:hypothetical protein
MSQPSSGVTYKDMGFSDWTLDLFDTAAYNTWLQFIVALSPVLTITVYSL